MKTTSRTPTLFEQAIEGARMRKKAAEENEKLMAKIAEIHRQSHEKLIAQILDRATGTLRKVLNQNKDFYVFINARTMDNSLGFYYNDGLSDDNILGFPLFCQRDQSSGITLTRYFGKRYFGKIESPVRFVEFKIEVSEVFHNPVFGHRIHSCTDFNKLTETKLETICDPEILMATCLDFLGIPE
ncbi:MAG: hypothetical protein AAB450_00935 [Patescibacteria group bacterium]